MIDARLIRAGWLPAAATLAAAAGGCGTSGVSGPATGKDPRPLVQEETTEAYMKQQARSKPQPAAAPRRR